MARRKLRSSPDNLRRFNGELMDLAESLAIEVAGFAARQLTYLARSAYGSGVTCYGDARPEGKHGALDLVDSGFSFGNIAFTSDGTSKIRSTRQKKYFRFLIGKYRVLPSGQQALPYQWSKVIRDAAAKRINRWAEANGY